MTPRRKNAVAYHEVVKVRGKRKGYIKVKGVKLHGRSKRALRKQKLKHNHGIILTSCMGYSRNRIVNGAMNR